MKKGDISFRVDGSIQMGLGHLTRCLSLALILREDFNIRFYSLLIPDFFIQEIVSFDFEVIILESEKSFFCELRDEIVIVDNYFYSSNNQLKIKSLGNKLVVIDDVHDKIYYADLIINLAPNVNTSCYLHAPYTKFAFGPQYLPLRPAFLPYIGAKVSSPNHNNLLICLGGTDETNMTLDVLSKVRGLEVENINIVIGNVYPHYDLLDNFITENHLFNCQIHRAVNQYKMVELMLNAGTAICSASTVSFEYLSINTGLLYLILTADNQSDWYNYAIDNLLGFELNESNLNNRHLLKMNTNLQSSLFDGNQSKRLKNLFNEL